MAQYRQRRLSHRLRGTVLGVLVVSVLLGVCLVAVPLHLEAQGGGEGKVLAQMPADARVLVIHSYHQGFTWTDDITRGIQEAFVPLAAEVELIFEFMDTRRIYSEMYFAQLAALYETKYADKRIDVIIASDDQALNFVLAHGDRIFPDVPVVFCSVSGFREEMRQTRPMTGLLEVIDIEATLDEALRLHPDTHTVAVVTDMTRTGQALKAKAEAAFNPYAEQVAFIYLEHKTVEELYPQVEALSEGTIVFLFVFSPDQTGRVFSHEYRLEMLAEHCDVPVYGVWEFYLGHGIVGGKLTSGFEEGRIAGTMALRILQGEHADEIPLETSPNRFMFDHVYLERFAIDEDVLPSRSIVVNRPFSLYQEYRYLIWGAGLIILFLLVVVVVLQMNIQMRKRAESSLRRSEERFRSVVESMNDIVFSLDRQQRHTGLFGSWVKRMGLTPEALLGKTATEFLGKQAGLAHERANERALTGENVTYEWSLVSDGETVDYQIALSPIHDADGAVSGLVGVGRDITNLRRVEEEVRKLNVELEKRVAERTVELQNKASELETFAYSVSHDLKAPLRGIDGYSQLLLSGYADRLDGEGQRYLHTIRRAATQMGQLIDDLLAYSRLERRDLVPGNIRLGDLIRSIVQERSDEIQAREIELVTDFEYQDAQVIADVESLTQALRNLVDNAIKFTQDEPTPRIEIGTRETSDGCQIWVRDNGIGFDMQYHDRIFEIFERLHRDEDYPGTGVGLAIVRKAAQRLGGRVWAESAPGEGSVFYIEIKRAEAR